MSYFFLELLAKLSLKLCQVCADPALPASSVSLSMVLKFV